MKIVTVLGARPQFIKASVVTRKILQNHKYHGRIEEVILHTGQHFDFNMSGVFFEELNIPRPLINIGVSSTRHGEMIAKMLVGVENFLLSSKPDWVLVYGDTNSTLAGALAAKKLGIKVVHVEAGLRSGNKNMPEEVNRILVDHLSTMLMCPTKNSLRNLACEGLTQGVHFVGDVMFDATLYHSEAARKRNDLSRWSLSESGYVVCTIHREENTCNLQNLTQIFNALFNIAEEVPVLLPLHPRTLKAISDFSIKVDHPNLRVISPLSYLEMLRVTMSASVVLTDSGGLQKEAYFLGVPCITMRNETEWVELIDCGVNQTTGANEEKIVSAYKNLSRKVSIKPTKFFGDGNAAEKILDHLLTF